MEMIKIVIWDLDDTFWKGTLSEGDIEVKKENISIVDELNNRGIINSIVSKNDRVQAINMLKCLGCLEKFVFPEISWEPKGYVVKKLLERIGLRADNAIFIDDNVSNLEEVKFYNKGITCIYPYEIQTLLEQDDRFEGKKDLCHSRLNQYRILEKKIKDKEKSVSNKEFLMQSDICIYICSKCDSEIDRIYELLQRTNQLNYTKKRSSLEELIEICNSSNIETAHIYAQDKYGDYGIIGFYALKDNKLLHFLFSCRILGMGVENYVYEKLGFPEIDIVGEVRTKLGMHVDWVSERWIDISDSKVNDGKLKKGLLVGGCDLEGACAYLAKYDVRKEFATVKNGYPIRTSDSVQLIATKEMNEKFQELICSKIPFFDTEISFKSEIFSGNFDFIVWSVVDDYIRGIWKNKNNATIKVGFGGYHDIEKNMLKYERKEIGYLVDNFEYIGPLSLSEVKYNIEKIINNISKKVKVILINGNEIDVSDWIGYQRVMRNIDCNCVVDEIVKKYENVSLLDMRKICISKDDFDTSIHKDNRHYKRNIYYKMARELERIIDA